MHDIHDQVRQDYTQIQHNLKHADMSSSVCPPIKEKPASREYEEKQGNGLSVDEYIMSSTITAREPRI